MQKSEQLYVEYEKPPKIMLKIMKLLEANNHRCISIVGSHNHKLLWCEKDICDNRNDIKYDTDSSSGTEVVYI